MAITENSPAEGSFLARPTVWGLTKTSGENPKPQFAIECVITEEGPEQGKLATWFGGFEGKGFEFTTTTLRKCGWDGKSAITDVQLDTESDIRIVIAHEEWDGKWNAKLKYINTLDERSGGTSGYLVEKQRMDEAEQSSFAREFAAKMKALQGGGAPAKPTAPGARPGVPQRPAAPAARPAAPAATRPAGAPGQRPGQRTAARPTAPAAAPVVNPDADDPGPSEPFGGQF